MTLTEQVKILDDKIRANKTEHNLDRQNAMISAYLLKIWGNMNT